MLHQDKSPCGGERVRSMTNTAVIDKLSQRGKVVIGRVDFRDQMLAYLAAEDWGTAPSNTAKDVHQTFSSLLWVLSFRLTPLIRCSSLDVCGVWTCRWTALKPDCTLRLSLSKTTRYNDAGRLRPRRHVLHSTAAVLHGMRWLDVGQLSKAWQSLL